MGETRYDQGSSVSYSFGIGAEHERLTVTLDGSVVAASGTVTMDAPHVLTATASARVPPSSIAQPIVAGAQAVLSAGDKPAAYQAHLEDMRAVYRAAGPDQARGRLMASVAVAYDGVQDSVRTRAAHEALGGRLFMFERKTAAGSASGPEGSAGAASVEAVTLLYVNGVHNKPSAAAASAAEVAALAEEALVGSSYQVGHFYNSSWSSRSRGLVPCIFQVSEASAPGVDLMTDINRVLSCLGGLPDLIEAARQLEDVTFSSGGTPARDAQLLATAIQHEIHLGRRVILVPHSQGNLMAQQALDILSSSVPPRGVDPTRCIGVLRLAPPSSESWIGHTPAHVRGIIVEGDFLLSFGRNQMPPLATERSSRFLRIANFFGFTDDAPARRFARLVAGVGIHKVVEGYLLSPEARAAVKSDLVALHATVTAGEDCTGAQKQIFATSGHRDGGPPSNLFVVPASSTGTDQLLGRLRTQSGEEPAITDLAWCPGGELYGVSYNQLFRVSVTTATLERVGNLGTSSSNTLTCSPFGELYLGAGEALYHVDRATAARTLIGSTGSDAYSGDIAFARDGTLFGTLKGPVNDYLVTIDPRTGGAQRVGTGTLGTAGVWGITFIGDQMYGLTTSQNAAVGRLIRIDTATGTATFVRNLTFHAFGSADVVPVRQR